MSLEDVSIFYPTSAKEWRKWLSKNHIKENAVWCVMYRKDSGMPTITWSEAVDEALCFGWIDSVKKPHDDQSAKQYFSKRKAGSTWSKINKDKVELLIRKNRMSEAGLAVIERAKEDGTWTYLDDVEALIIPEDLEQALTVHEGALEFFKNQSKSAQKGMLTWVLFAKREETRSKRILEIVSCAAEGKKPTQF